MTVIRADEPYTGEGARPHIPSPQLPSSPDDLHSMFHTRAAHWSPKHELMSKLITVYNGGTLEEYADYFTDENRIHIVNMLRLGVDDLTGLAGQVLPLFFAPDNDSPKAKARAEKLEEICYGYNAAGRKSGGVDMAGLAHVLAFWLVLSASAVAMVLPDYRRKTPFFTFRDPRTFFAPVGYNSWEQSALNGSLFAYQMTLGELKRRYPEHEVELGQVHGKHTHAMTTGWKPTNTLVGAGSDDEDARMIWTGEYYHSDCWYVSTLDDERVTLVGSEQGDRGHPGVDPTVVYELYNPDDARSMVADQISIQVAQSRLYSQQLAYNDRSIFPPMFGSPLKHNKLRYGPQGYNPFDTQMGEKPAFFQAAPPNPIQANQMMEFGMVLMRILNRNPESFQGAGDANSGKAISTLKAGVNATVENSMWPAFFQGHPKLYGKSMIMDINIWGQERKKISGRTPALHRSRRSVPTSQSYRPLTDLDGHEDECEIEPGIALRGYEGRLELMQLKNAGLLSMDSSLEQLDVVREPQEEKRKIQRDALEQLEFADIATRAQPGPSGVSQLMPGAIAKLMKLMGEESLDVFEARAKLEEAGEFSVPVAPPPPMGAPGEIPALPAGPGGGGMAELEAALGGAAPPPSLELVRGEMAS